MQPIKKFILAHKIIVAISLIAMTGIGYWGYSKLTDTSTEPRYVTGVVEKGSVIASISGTGQVSASNQVELNTKASGDVVAITVTNSQEVAAGALIAQLDARDAQKTVRDAEVNLASARLALDKLKKPADQLSLLQAEHALEQAKESKQSALDNLTKAYGDGFNTVAATFLDLPTAITGINDVFFKKTLDAGMENITWYMNQASSEILGERDKALGYQNAVYTGYDASRDAYTKNLAQYTSASRISDTQTIETLVESTYETTRTVADTLKTSGTYVSFITDSLQKRNAAFPPAVTTQQTNLNNYTENINGHLLDLSSIMRSIQTSKETITNADRTIAEKTESIAKLKAGADALDLESQELAVRQRENALLDAREKLADYYIRAPFAGTIAKLNAKRSDSLSSGASVATLITKQKLAEISLNEVDVAKVKVGQKTMLTFDAVEGLGISGIVAEIDTVGTVSQGVVSYTIKIQFDTQDDRIKPGMSVSAAIITDARQDVLTIPNSAIKTQGDTQYVELFDTPLAAATGTQGVASSVAPRRQTVEAGITNDSITEIVSGLSEGQQIVVRTINITQTTTQTAPSLFPTGGRNIGR